MKVIVGMFGLQKASSNLSSAIRSECVPLASSYKQIQQQQIKIDLEKVFRCKGLQIVGVHPNSV